MSLTTLINRFCDAIEKAEGYGVAGSIPTDANNPGDLAVGDVGCGFVDSSGPHAAQITKFPNYEAGRNALFHQVWRMLSGNSRVYNLDMSIAEVAIKYAGDPNWGVNVARELGVSANMTLRELVSANQ